MGACLVARMHITARAAKGTLHVADLCPVRVMRFWSGEIETDGRGEEDSYCVDDDAHDHRTFQLLLT